MLSFFRGQHGSKFVAVFLGLVLLAMVATGVGTQGGLGNVGSLLSANGDAVAKVGTVTLEKADVAQIAQSYLTRQREQQPDITMKALVHQGIVDKIINEKVSDTALVAFGSSQGMRVSKRLVDAQIADIKPFYGIDGKFDHSKMVELLARQNLTEQQFRDDFALVELRNQFTVPVAGGAFMPRGLASSYAAMFMENRTGQIAAIPAEAMVNTPQPNDSQINAYYARHLAQFTLPERRAIEFAVYDKTKFTEAAKPTSAEIAAVYTKDKAKYAPKDLLTVTQLIIPDETKARAAYAKARAGAPVSQVAKGDGFQSVTLAAQDKAAYTGNTAPEVADAVFQTGRGALAPLTKSALGWYIVRVDSVTHDEGKSLDAARDEITKTLTAAKIETVFADFQNKLADRASAGARFDELVKTYGGAVVTTPLIAANGASDDRAFRPTPDMQAMIKDAFKPDTKTTSEPLIVAYGKTKDQVALYHVKAITLAGPKPLAAIRGDVAHAAQIELAAKAARLIAADVVVKVNKGMALTTALQTTGLRLPPAQAFTGSRLQLMQQAQQAHQPIPAPVTALFSLGVHHAKLVEFPARNGWFVVFVDQTVAGDVRKAPQIVDQVQQSFGKTYGQEIMAEFAHAAQDKVGVVRYPAHIRALNTALPGNESQ
jgi:peptidyl-prolyl cis-trans isomerase D